MRFRILGAVLWFALASPALAGTKNLILLPAIPTNRAVVVFHGAGGYAKNIVQSQEEPITEVLLDRGFAVAASDADGPENWGNPASVRSYLHLIHRLQHRLGYTRIFLMGGSMGALDEMQVLGYVHPEAVSLLSPVCNVSTVPLLQAGVEVAWPKGEPGYLSPVIPYPYNGLRVNIWASPEDTWVPKVANRDICARELRRRGASVREMATTGEHTNTPYMLSPSTVPDFFQKVAQKRQDQVARS